MADGVGRGPYWDSLSRAVPQLVVDFDTEQPMDLRARERRSMVRRILKAHGRKLLRYAGVSAIGVTAGQALLFLLYTVADLHAVLANTLAVTIATVPSYLLNRAWVWGKSGGHSVTAEILPFWGMAFLGLLLSNMLVAVAERQSDWWLIINAANLTAFGLLWVAKYVLLDRVLFAQAAESSGRGESVEQAA